MTQGYQHEADVLPAPQQPAPQQPGSPATSSPATSSRVLRYERIALVDLLDRLLAGGVVITGEVRLAIADVDLVNVSLRALITSVSSALDHGSVVPTDDS